MTAAQLVKAIEILSKYKDVLDMLNDFMVNHDVKYIIKDLISIVEKIEQITTSEAEHTTDPVTNASN